MAYSSTLHLVDKLKEVEKLPQFLDTLCKETGCDQSLSFNMNLALEEALVNVINYAYPHDGTMHHFTLDVEEITKPQHSLLFTLTDSGKPFDPTAAGETDITLSAEERQIGGLGIFLVRQLMDNVSYKYKDKKNVLLMQKNI